MENRQGLASPGKIKFQNARPQDFARRPHHDYADIIEQLQKFATMLLKTEFAKLETQLGFKFNQQGLLADERFRNHCSPSTCMIFDWVHCTVASGGIFQWVLNWFVLDLKAETRLNTKDLDNYQATFVSPGWMKRPPKEFFQWRVVDDRTSHCRGFAGEQVFALITLALFVQHVLVPERKMAAQG